MDVLRNAEIRFTQALALNDPFELRPSFNTLFTLDDLNERIAENPVDFRPHLRREYEKLPHDLRSQTPYSVFEQTALQLLNSPEGRAVFGVMLGAVVGIAERLTPQVRQMFVQQFGRNVGILSLSELRDSPLMWAHYAAEHRGFVIGFDSTHLYFNRRRAPRDEFYHLRRVRYLERIAPHGLRHVSGVDLLASKTADWSYEQEWRMLAPIADAKRTLGSGDEAIHLFDLPPDSVPERCKLGVASRGFQAAFCS